MGARQTFVVPVLPNENLSALPPLASKPLRMPGPSKERMSLGGLRLLGAKARAVCLIAWSTFTAIYTEYLSHETRFLQPLTAARILGSPAAMAASVPLS